jgi:radical SAM superfamily enzyme YgiQ (UPF0313 family)
MRIGILELIRGEVGRRLDKWVYGHIVDRQYASIMPQAVSAWCRELGHRVFYATYFGQKDPKQLLPSDLDVVFISCCTQASALAYALAKLYRQEKTITVIGGPHAKQFPDDSLRFFDVVVKECDKNLITHILSNYNRGEIITSGHTLLDIPSVQERLPEIQASTFWRGKPRPSSSIPMLASIGCPYTCDFCVEWNNPYSLLPLDRLEEDLRFILENFPGVLVSFHDPNFAVKFDDVFAVMERLPRLKRNWYLIESTLSVLRASRLERLRDTGCYCVVPGIESWAAYTSKSCSSDQGSAVNPRQKLEQVLEQFEAIYDYVPVILANLIFGLDVDEGDEPVELTKEFMTRVPFVTPNINIPIPFGGTPLCDRYMAEGRILTSMPFTFYNTPYLVTTVKNYSPVVYYEKLIEIFSHMTSVGILLRRLQATHGIARFLYNPLRNFARRQMLNTFRHISRLMGTDEQFRAFHEGESDILPEFYHQRYEHLLGPYATLMSREDRQPMLI